MADENGFVDVPIVTTEDVPIGMLRLRKDIASDVATCVVAGLQFGLEWGVRSGERAELVAARLVAVPVERSPAPKEPPDPVIA